MTHDRTKEGRRRLIRIMAARKRIKKHDGAMVALMAPSAVSKKLAKAGIVDEDTVSSDGLHMTLLYLGKSKDIDKVTLQAIGRAVERVCARHAPLKMSVTGSGMFTKGEKGTPVYVTPNAKGLSSLQADLERAVGDIVDLPSEHGWVPHMTVGYSCDDRPQAPLLGKPVEWTARELRLQVGGEKVADVPLGRPLSRRAEKNGSGEKPKLLYERVNRKGLGPGMGLGVGPGGLCQCPKCGYEVIHDFGIPCTQEKCPKCGIEMLRADAGESGVVMPYKPGMGLGAGPGGLCKCQECGYKVVHESGTPCTQKKCPKCGGEMLRAGLEESTEKQNEKAYVGPLEEQTEENENFREVLSTGKHSQLVLMSLKPGEEIGEEVHEDVDQFFRIDDGEAVFMIEGKKKRVEAGGAALVPAGTSHNVTNPSSDKPLKMYVLYSPPNHPKGTVHKTKEEAEVEEQEAGDMPLSARAEDGELPEGSPAEWTDVELMSSITLPAQLAELRKDLDLMDAVLGEVSKRKLRSGGLTMMPGEEPKLFLLLSYGLPLGFFETEGNANLAKARMVDAFAKGEKMDLLPNNEAFYNMEIRDSVRDAGYRVTDELQECSSHEAGELIKHPFYEKNRRKMAEKAIEVVPVPREELDPAEGEVSPESIVSGGTPTHDNSEHASKDVRNSGSGYLAGKRKENSDKFREAIEDFTKPATERLKNRMRMREEGLDPDKMADDAQMAMDTLPIMADPAQWSDEQLSEVISSPKLLGELKSKPELLAKVLEQVKKRRISSQVAPRDIGEWREQGIFLLRGMTPYYPNVVGIFDNRSVAEHVRTRLINLFGEGGRTDLLGLPDLPRALVSHVAQNVAKGIVDEWVEKNPNEFDEGEEWEEETEIRGKLRSSGIIEKDIDDFLNHPFYKSRRRKLAEDLLDIEKAPDVFHPDPAVINRGTVPHLDDQEKISGAVVKHNRKTPEGKDVIRTFEGRDKREIALDDALEHITTKARKRYKAMEEGMNPEELSDDGVVASSFHRILRASCALHDAEDSDGVDRLSRQLNLYIERRAHFVPSEKTKTPPMWRSNMDYAGFENSPWRGSMSEFKKKFPGGLKDFLKWRRKSQKERYRMFKLKKASIAINAEALGDADTVLEALALLSTHEDGSLLEKIAHMVPAGGDDVSKLGNKEPKIWSDDPDWDSIEEYLDAYRKRRKSDASDGQLALDAAMEMVRYWAENLKDPSIKRRRK